MRRRSAPLAHEGEKVKLQHGIALVLLIALISGAVAAGGTPPALPHQFFGDVTIGGSPAPARTVITAMIGDTECGSILVTDAGRYGDPDWCLGNRLLVTGTSEQSGETITFSAGGVAARETAVFIPGGVTHLDLSFEETVATPTAGFQTNITSGPAPLTIQFTDTSLGDLVSREWNFGDGTNSTGINPVHTYAAPGTYTVTLTVTNAAGSDSATATIIVREAGAVEIVRGPYFTGTTTTATFVNWMTQEPVAGTVEYADDAYYTANGRYENFVADTAETGFHHIALEDLAPDTLYHYRIVAGNTTTGDHTFRTFPEDGGFTFIVYGDTQMPANIKIVADRIAEEEPLFVLHTGDQVNGVEDADEWNDFFRNSGRMLANTTIYTTMGNHEKNHTAYYENFGLPQRYSFTCSDAQFVILDDNNWVDLDRESAWLEEDLDSDAAWKFVAHHHPPYSSTPDRTGGWILLRAWGETMRDAGVSAVFNGHIHAYERYLVDGINYVVAGTGAGPLYQLGDEKPEGYQTSLEGTLGYTKITLHPNGTTVAEFVRVARLSEENSVLEIYPSDSVFETYTMTRPPRSDLAAVNLTTPGDITVGIACTVTGTVENIGDAVSRACSAVLTVDDLEIGTAAVGVLGPGETAEVSFTWIPAAAGDATLTFVVDPDAATPDVNRRNNDLTTTVAIVGSGPGHAPVADFSTNVTSGVAPLTVTFTDGSTGVATWSWDFGDNTTSADQNPVHTYEAPGNYTVTLTVTNAAGSDSMTTAITVTVPVGSIAVTSMPGGAAIWLDGTDTGLTTNTTLINVSAGEHTITLKLAGYADASTPVTVEAGKTTSIHLDLTTLTGSLTVTSAPAGARIFIDGADTGKLTNTTIDGIGVGTHTVTLKKDGYVDATKTVIMTAGETTALHLNLDEIVTAPVAGFSTNVTSGVAPLTVQFTDTSSGSPDTWEWDFGDGATSTEKNPVHTYNQTGRFTVTLTVTNAAGSSSKAGAIIVQEIPPQPPKAAESFTLESDAVNVSVGDDGKQQVIFNATAGAGEIGDDNRTIHFQSHGLSITIETEGLTDGTGNVTGVHLESTPFNATVGSAGNVSVSFSADMDSYNPALGIAASIYEQPSPEASEAFALAAQDEDSEIASIAYAVYFIKTNLTGDDRIRDATLRLTASEDWVDANGGPDLVRIFRLGDDGNRSVLPTTYEGKEGDMMVFTAVSPEGFSVFALGAMTAPSPPAPAPSRSSGGGGGSRASVGAAGNLKIGEYITFSMDQTAISAVTLTADDYVKEVMVTVAKGSLPRDARPPAGTVYQYIETSLYRAAAKDFSALQIQFTIPTAWLAEQKCTANEINLFRHTTDGWLEVPVRVIGEENSDAIFSASADAFGLFAITSIGKAPDVKEPALEPAEPETTPSTPAADVTTAPAGSAPTPGFGALAVLASLGVVALLALRRK